MKAIPKFEDKALVLQLRNHSIHAFDLLFYKYHNKLYSFAFSLLKNEEDSKEIVQETFCRIWDKRQELDNSKSFKSYLFTITYNLIIDQLRFRLKDKEYRKSLLEYFECNVVLNENKADYNILSDKIKLAVEDFPEKRRQIYLMSREEGLSQKEIAERLGISVKTVENQINLSLKGIRSSLGKDLLIFLFLWLYH